MEAILASASFDALRYGCVALIISKNDDEARLGSEDDCEGDGRRRLWRFRSGSPVTEPDPFTIVDTVDMMLKLDEEWYRLYSG